jgi:E3 ubiquitin-protein ligase BAH
MKFAHEFKTALIREGFPREWIDLSIPYGQLKKVLKKVSTELQEMGLDPATLAQLSSDPRTRDGRRRSEEGTVAYRYDLEGRIWSAYLNLNIPKLTSASADQKEFRPKLTLFFEGDLAVNAAFSPDTRAFLETLVSKHGGPSGSSEDSVVEDKALSRKGSTTSYGPGVRAVEVNLTFDGEFFDLIQGNVGALEQLQAEQQVAITNEIVELSKELGTITQPPTRFKSLKKTDMYKWREL